MARVRIKDIAEQAGVSPATVSRYLNNTPGAMTEETRARIAEVVERTGYRPLAAARSLRTDRSQLLGVVLADIANPYSSAMLEALSREAEAAGYSLMTAIAGNDPATEASALERLLDAGADALIINTCGGNDEALRDASLRVPVVLLDRDLDGGIAGGGKRLDLVTSNNSELVDGLVEELVGCGCKRILLFTQAGISSSIRRERAASFTSLGAESKARSSRSEATRARRLRSPGSSMRLARRALSGLFPSTASCSCSSWKRCRLRFRSSTMTPKTAFTWRRSTSTPGTACLWEA